MHLINLLSIYCMSGGCCIMNYFKFAQIEKVHRNPLIKQFFGILLILVFALCNTPTRVLHQLFANHTDFVDQHLSNSKSPRLNTAGIDCHCQSNVVVSPYTFGDCLSISKIITGFTSFSTWSIVSNPFSRNITFGLRGPPDLIA